MLSKANVGIAGEMRVCAELLKKGYDASVILGNAKATDIIVTGEAGRFLRIEVKTSKNGRNFMTGFFPKYTDPEKMHPDIWIFYMPDKNLSENGDRFFIASHKEVESMQLKVNKGSKTEKGKGADNIPLKIIADGDYENRWTLISAKLQS